MTIFKFLLWIIGAIVVCAGVHILGGSSEGLPMWQSIGGYVLIYGGAWMVNYGLSSNK